MQPRWRIDELAAIVGRALAENGRAAQPSARVRDVPDARTIRYYTTLALVDRPLEMRGRTAYYGWRHVWQLLAIKRQQAAGDSLVQIQERLTGASEMTLRRLAAAPAGFEEAIKRNVNRKTDRDADRATADSSEVVATEGSTTAATPFWAIPPSDGASPPLAQSPDTPQASAPTATARLAHRPAPPQQPVVARPAVHLRLEEGVTLVIEGVEWGEISQEHLAALGPAARDLANQLRRLRRSAPRTGAQHDSSRSSV